MRRRRTRQPAGDPRARRRLQIAAAYAIAIAGIVIVSLFVQGSPQRSSTTSEPTAPALQATEFSSRVIYHSPQTPGYTAWVGAWTMPDGSLMTAFDQATGPVDPAQRALAPAAVLAELGDSHLIQARDFWGLNVKLVYLRSTDGGKTWATWRTDPLKGVELPTTGQAIVALKDGTVIQRLDGDVLRFDPSVPHTGFLERLAPGATGWSAPQVLLDPARYEYGITRIRALRDGRVVATGTVTNTPASTPPYARGPSSPLLMVSADNGHTWKNGLTIPPGLGYLAGDEWDIAELPSGDLLAVLRTPPAADVTNREVDKVALLKQHGDGWVMTRLTTAPFPETGHPELLATKAGQVIYFGTSGVEYTRDAGATWAPLAGAFNTQYYPRSTMTSDGVIHVFSHRGHDDAYGAVDQAIVEQDFQLVTPKGG